MRRTNPIKRCSRDSKDPNTTSPRRARWGVRAALVPVAALSAVSVLTPLAAGQTTTWVGPATGDWGTAANWNGGVPNSSATTALVDDGNVQNTSVSIAGNFTVGTLVISGGDQVTLGNNLTLAVPVLLNNAGTFTLAPVANNSTLSTGGASMSISGGGTIVLQGANSVLAGGGTMNNLNNLIRGQGFIGNNNTFFINGGTVNADVSGGSIFVDPVPTGMSNSGVMTSSNGGLLRFNGQFGGGMTNTGTISAQNGSVTQFENSFSISGGTFTTSGTGVVKTAASNTVSYASLGNLGNWTLENNSTSNYSGDLFNSGSINMTAGANNVLFNFTSGTTNLTGAGIINMGSTGGGEAIIGNGGGRLVNVNNTIRGSGILGNNNQRFTNGASGVISADVSGVRLLIDSVAEADSFVNNGLMRAVGGGLLQLTGQFGGGLNNTLGTISALTGSEVQLYNSIFILGGTINSSGTGVVRVAANQIADLQSNTLAANLVVDNNAILRLNAGTITNSGSININPAANNSLLNLGGGTVILTGGGSVNLNTGTASAFIGGSGTLVNLNNLIRGAGNIANNNISFVNSGTISADINGAGLFVDPVNVATLDFSNAGTMQAVNGGILQLTGQFGGGFNNTGGRIIAGNGSQVQLLSAASISGGTFASVGTGTVNVVGGHTAFLSDVSSSAAWVVSNNATMNAGGTFDNNNTITLAPTANNAVLNPNGNLNLNGTGTVLLTDGGGGGQSFFGSTGSSIAIGSGQTVRGVGNIANNAVAIVNNGAINADQSGKTIFVDPVNAVNGFVNNNLMTATNGGVLQLTGQFAGGVTNNGTISAGTASQVQLLSSIGITGGTLTTTGTGAVEVATNHTAFVANIANTGALNIQNNATLNGAGTMSNNGVISVNPGASNSVFNCNSGTLTVTGSGTIVMNAGTGGTAFLGSTGGAIDLNVPVRGRGVIANNSVVIVNRNLIAASGGGEIFVDPVNAVNGFQNLGIMRAETGSQLQLNGQFSGGVTNSGNIDIDPGGTLLTNSSHQLSGGTVTLDGTWNATNSSNSDVVNFRGSGTLNISNSARVGVLANGGSLATSRLGAIATSANGRLDLNDNDMVVDYTGATPVTSIRTQIGSAYNNGPWNGATGITSSSAAAAFATSTKTGLGYLDNTAGAFANFSGQAVDNTSVLVKYTYMGDANLDGQVDITDLARLATAWQTNGNWENGDFNYTGFVDISDLALLATNWQVGVGAPLAMSFDQALASVGLGGVSVPEPASVVALMALVGAGRRRRLAAR